MARYKLVSVSHKQLLLFIHLGGAAFCPKYTFPTHAMQTKVPAETPLCDSVLIFGIQPSELDKISLEERKRLKNAAALFKGPSKKNCKIIVCLPDTD